MPGIRKAKAVRAIVRPDRRDEYLERWRRYASAAAAVGARVRLLEDQVLPGRFLELTEHQAGEGVELALEQAVQAAELQRSCVRREGDEVLYREVRLGV
ncbi:MAG: hypothetical protein AMS25_08565 [Gemmatimonas sp. SM23_52]|nr:MAG: hypothetical protein AMS25_08565 [Gemmatimonas sp. SM23_52]